jgi:hypothetical protein
MSTAREIALALAGRRAQRLADGSFLVPCPVPSHGKGRGDHNPSLRIGDGQTRLLVHCYAGCDPRDVLDELRRRGLLNGALTRGPSPPPRSSPAAAREADKARARFKWAREIWHAARDPRGTLAEAYLRFRRLVLDGDLAGHVLRFHPRCPWWNESAERIEFLPALIVPFRSIDDDEITAIHRIRLDQPERWPKAERRMLGVVGRSAVKLDGDGGGELAIGEGVETCMAARQLDIRAGAVWALGSAGGIARFPVLPNIHALRILGENDHTNEQAVEQCGLRWQAAGRCVRVIRPDPDCKDLNDVLERRVP